MAAAPTVPTDDKNANNNNVENNLTDSIQLKTTDKLVKEVIPTDKEKEVIARNASSDIEEKPKKNL
ncbi:MAG TPA: hypothetical protein VFV86_05625 [Nitrososphaeraceae archaeon]|nr:hypothetical protein [Nitrososphaeraceae archaeon]